MTFLRCFIVLSICCLVSGCGPSYKTTYRFSPPPDELGRSCAAGCLERLQGCKARCKAELYQCERLEDIRAENEYLKYANSRLKSGQKLKKHRHHFKSYTACRNSCSKECDVHHRICHVNCGGDVTEQTICTARCDQK